jgi:hypothetical protein
MEFFDKEIHTFKGTIQKPKPTIEMKIFFVDREKAEELVKFWLEKVGKRGEAKFEAGGNFKNILLIDLEYTIKSMQGGGAVGSNFQWVLSVTATILTDNSEPEE